MDSHTGEKPLPCHQRDSEIQAEIPSEQVPDHTGEKPLYCLDCNTRCSSDEDLLFHIKQHAIESLNEKKSFMCSECDYTSATEAELGLHMKSHTGESPVKFINTSFSKILTSSPCNRGATRLFYSSQPPSSSENLNNKNTKEVNKRARGTSLSPEYAQAQKKKATTLLVSNIPTCK